MKRRLALFALAAFFGLVSPVVAETIYVTLNKTQALNFDRSAATVLVGNPAVVSVAVETTRLIFLTGKSPGETNLLVLDREGHEILNYDVVVAPELERHVTIHRSTSGVATMNCDPRCYPVVVSGGNKVVVSGSNKKK